MGSQPFSGSLQWKLETSADFISFVRRRQRIYDAVSKHDRTPADLTAIRCLPYFEYETCQAEQTIPAEVFYDGD